MITMKRGLFCILFLAGILMFSFCFFPKGAFAAACPVTDGGAGDGDGSANGTITINANATWTPSDATAWDCSGLDVHVTNSATLTFASNTGSGYYGWLSVDNVTIDLGSAISSNARGCTAPVSNADGYGPNSSNICTQGYQYGGGDYITNAAAGGASHGGKGGDGTDNGTVRAGTHTTYGSAIAPLKFGASGASSFSAAGGTGGGVVYLQITGTLTLNGSISADATDGTYNDNAGNPVGGGGGAGGSVYITANHIDGTGSVSANGGDGANANYDGGGGSGGRVAIFVTSDGTFVPSSSSITASAGAAYGNATAGAKGTGFFKHTTDSVVLIFEGFSFDDTDYSSAEWVIDSAATNLYCTTDAISPSITTTAVLTLGGTLDCETSSVTSFNVSTSGTFSVVSNTNWSLDYGSMDWDIPDGGSYTFTNVTITLPQEKIWTIDDAIGITFAGTSTINANISWTALSSLTLNATSSLVADGKGCLGGVTNNEGGHEPNSSNVCVDRGSGVGGGGQGHGTSAAGGGHGGAGGASANGATGGTTYDSSTAPEKFGAGGGAIYTQDGANGGGYIRIVTTGDLVLNGTISADGAVGGAYNDGNTYGAGSGAGGSIYLSIGGDVSGTTGSISVVGGTSPDYTNDAGGGGGGRLSIVYGADSYTGTLAATFTAATVAAGGVGPGSAADGSVGTVNFTQTVSLASIVITDTSGYTSDPTPVITATSVGSTPTHIAFSCNGGSNWSSWLVYPDDDVVNDGDGPAFDMTADATGCSATNELKTISAKVKDLSSESSSVSDTTTYDTVAPTVVNVSSSNANGTYDVDEVITVTVQFSDVSMVVTGTPRIELDMDDTDRQATYSSTSTDTLSFTYTVVTGDNKADLDYTGTGALTLNGGTISDSAGNTATLTLASPGAAGSLGSNKNIVISTNQEPTASTVTAVQGTDGTSDVTITFIMDDPDDDNTLQAKIEYSLNGGSSWNDPTISTTGSETSATYGDPSVNNAATYQIGQAGAYITSSSGANTVTIIWEAATDVSASTDISNARIRVTPYDSLVEGTAASSSNFILDLVDPTSLASLAHGASSTTQTVLTWTPASDTNFGHYEIWYASISTDATNRTGGAIEWDDSDVGALGTASTATTTVIGNLRNKHVTIFAIDDFGNELTTTTLYISALTDDPDTLTEDTHATVTYTVMVTSPTSLDDYGIGEPVTIRWTTGGTGSFSFVTLYSSTDGVHYNEIVKNISAYAGQYLWTPSGLTDDTVAVRVDATDLVDVLATDVSEEFTVALALGADENDSDGALGIPSDDVLGSSSDVPTGAYMRSLSWNTVYYVDSNRVRHPFLDAQTFFTYASDFSSVLFTEDSVLKDFTLGAPMLPKPGVILIKVQSVPKVYIMSDSGALRWITSEDVARNLFGDRWADYVIDVPVTAWSHFTFGDDVTNAEDVEVNVEAMKTREEVNR